MTNEIENGDIARDGITGFEGVVICTTQWLYGCERLSLQPQALNKDGQVQEAKGFDRPQLVLVRKASKKTEINTGGPRPAPSRNPDQSR